MMPLKQSIPKHSFVFNYLTSCDCSCQNFTADGDMVFSLLTSDEKKAMIGDVLSPVLSFANPLFGKQLFSWGT